MACIELMYIFSLLSCFLSQLALAAPSFDQVFEVATGNVLGTCDPYKSILGPMFQEMQTINANTVNKLETDQYNTNAETQKLLKSMFGINPGSDGKVPKGGISLSKLTKVRNWFADLENEISAVPEADTKPRLYCDSTFMQYMRGSDIVPNSGGKTLNQVYDKKYVSNVSLTVPKQRKALQLIELQNHIFLITDKGQNEWVHLAKTSWDLFNAYPSSPKNPTYCANNKWYGWTLEGDSVMDRLQPIVILCPESFTKQNLYNEDIPDQLDLSPQPVGKVLDQMEPRVLTWYHEMFHVVFDPSGGVERSPDASYWRARKDSNGRLVPEWPKQKAGYENSGININGAVECMYLALYDAATPSTNPIQQVRCTKNPESYAWFAVATYLSTVGKAHQDWSTGACRDQGSSAATVTVTRGNVPKRTPAFENFRATNESFTFTA